MNLLSKEDLQWWWEQDNKPCSLEEFTSYYYATWGKTTSNSRNHNYSPMNLTVYRPRGYTLPVMIITGILWLLGVREPKKEVVKKKSKNPLKDYTSAPTKTIFTTEQFYKKIDMVMDVKELQSEMITILATINPDKFTVWSYGYKDNLLIKEVDIAPEYLPKEKWQTLKSRFPFIRRIRKKGKFITILFKKTSKKNLK